MRRLYYLAQDIDTTDAISVRLHAEGISDWNFHVLAKDPSGLYSHHIHSALPHHDKDVIRIGEIGGLYGFFASLLGSLLVLFAGDFSWMSGWFDVLTMVVIGVLLGGLLGVRKGMRSENHRLATFHDDIEAGKHLIMVDVRKEDKPNIRELMNMEFRQVKYGGNESTFVRPFKESERINPQPFQRQPGAARRELE
jgi:hypothetical protein